MDLATLQTLLQVGWPGIVTVACGILWKQYATVQAARVDDMKAVLTVELADIKQRLAVIENDLRIARTAQAVSASLDGQNMPG